MENKNQPQHTQRNNYNQNPKQGHGVGKQDQSGNLKKGTPGQNKKER